MAEPRHDSPSEGMAASPFASFVLAEATATQPRADDEEEDRARDDRDERGDNDEDDDDDDDDDAAELDSLPSISTSVLSPSDAGSEADSSDAQREWEASLEQLQLMLTMVLVPFAGKFLGRKFAYWGWARYMEWAHDVEIRWTSKTAFNAAGAVGASATL